MKRVEGWTYDYSNALGMEYAFRQKQSGEMEAYTADRTHYSQREINIVHGKGADGSIPREVHLIKHLFDGEIVG